MNPPDVSCASVCRGYDQNLSQAQRSKKYSAAFRDIGGQPAEFLSEEMDIEVR